MPRTGVVLEDRAGGTYDQVKAQFIRLFGGGDPDFQVTRDSVEDVLDRLMVEGESYREKYGIEVNDSNLEMAVSHVIANLTEGEMALSFYTEKPMRAVLLGREEIPAATPVLPLKPAALPKPASPGGWKQFWSGFGFYQKEMSDHESREKDYQVSRERQEQYEKNREAMAAYARQVEEREQAGDRKGKSPEETRVRRNFESLSRQFLPEKKERHREGYRREKGQEKRTPKPGSHR